MKNIVYIVYRSIDYCGDIIEAVYECEIDAMNLCNQHACGWDYKEYEVIRHEDLTSTDLMRMKTIKKYTAKEIARAQRMNCSYKKLNHKDRSFVDSVKEYMQSIEKDFNYTGNP
jgi:hypothetical protein